MCCGDVFFSFPVLICEKVNKTDDFQSDTLFDKSVINLEIPLVVRLEGTNVDNAKQILKDSGLPIQSAVDLDDAAKKATAALK